MTAQLTTDQDHLRTSNWLRVSWRRSREALGDVDFPNADYTGEGQRDSVLLRAAQPVLAAMSAEIENEPVSLLLTDAKGIVLTRDGGDGSLVRDLDRVRLAPGFRYTESAVGTNGIGTALEVGAPVLVNGDQHYVGPLRTFSCAGALITHPITGALLGVVDLTTQAPNTNSLLLSFAKLAAQRIQERILEDASDLERALLHAYYAACQHSGRPVIAVGDDVLMVNSLTQQHFDSHDQAAIIDQTRDARGRAKPFTMLADLPSGTAVRLSYQPAFAGERLAGGIVRIKEQIPKRPEPRSAQVPVLPSLAGVSALWQHTARDVVATCRRREWLIIEGEVGTGKTALLRAAHQRVSSQRPLAMVDAAEAGGQLVDRVIGELENEADVAILHAQALTDEDVLALGELLQPLSAASQKDGPWIALTTCPVADFPAFFRLFPKTVTVPPLRHRTEDIPDLVRHLLRNLGAGDVSLSQAALNQLKRLGWPSNVAQLRHVLEEVLRHRRSGVVEPVELPAECKAATRRHLSKIESMERDAIVDALALHGGDKPAAATALGISRATIYRKIREFGITV